MAPNYQIQCIISRDVTQDDFEAAGASMSFPAASTPRGTVNTTIVTLSSHTVPLVQRPALNITTSISAGYVTWPNDMVLYTANLTNAGNVHLRNVTLLSNVPGGLVNSADEVTDCAMPQIIPAKSFVSCVRDIVFTTPLIRSGNKTLRANATAVNLPNGTVVPAPMQKVTMPYCENATTRE